MNNERAKRKLSAILSADVKGYSQLMGEDELTTIETLKKYREMISTSVALFRGRVVDSPGDNLLAEFGSVVDAVECAVKVQEELKKENDELPENRRMAFRIGINLGDVVEDGERIYGDGVNIAARIEKLAEAGGICISRAAYDQIKRKLSLSFEYLGEHLVKNIDEPARVYRISNQPESAEATEEFKSLEPASIEKMAYPLPDKPSIAVLSFTNMSGDPTQDYIGDGLSENITTALSKVGGMFVIARNSTFVYKGKAVKVQQVAEELGVQYVLEGSVQKSGDQLRVTAQLIDALSGYHLWSEKYDRKMEDLFDLQDEITKKIVVSLQVELMRGEEALIEARDTDNLEAWSKVAKAYNFWIKFTKEDNERARKLYEEAARLDPTYATACACLGWTHFIDLYLEYSDSPSDSLKRAHEAGQKTLALDDQHPYVFAMQGGIHLMQRQYDKALTKLKKSVAIDPNYYGGHHMLAQVMFYLGRFEESLEREKKAIRLSPHYPALFLVYLARNYFHLGRYEEAIATLKQLDDRAKKGEYPTWWSPLCLAMVCEESDREEEASAYLAKALRLNPNLSLEFWKSYSRFFKNPAHLQRELESFRNAGFPEKPRQAVQDKPSIAVLPFVNMSNDPEQEYFSDGMTEELIGALAKLEGLKVISRTSAFYFKEKDVDLRTIGEKLNVDNVLEGSVRKAGNKLRISAQLIKVADDTHLWAETFNRELIDVFDIQEQISQAIIKNLKVTLLGKKIETLVKDYTQKPEAYELFLKGKYFENKGPADFEKGIEYMERAIKADAGFVPAYAYLASKLNIKTTLWSLPPWETKRKVNALQRKALELDDNYAFTYVSMARNEMNEFDWQGAENSSKRAIELSPGSPGCYTGYSNYLAAVGCMDEAILEIRRAVELDPLSSIHRATLGSLLVFTGQLDQAIEVSKEILELDANNHWGLSNLAMAWAGKGMYDKAISILQGFRKIPYLAARLGYLYGKAGNKEKAKIILDDFLERSNRDYFSPYFIAYVYACMDIDKAFEWLDRAYEVRDPNQWIMKVDCCLEGLHSDPRWAEQMEKRGLSD